MLLAIYGDSLSMPRAVLCIRTADTFGELVADGLAKVGHHVRLYTRSRPGEPIDIVKDTLKKDAWYFGRTSPSCCIIQLGIVDCAPRSVPGALKAWIDRAPAGIGQLIKKVMRKAKPMLLERDIFTRETEPEAFRSNLSEMIRLALENHDRVLVLNICPHHPAIEARSPKLGESIALYNAIISSCVDAADASGRVTLVDVFGAVRAGSIDELVNAEDGHHITVKGHRAYADAILNHLLPSVA